MHECTHVGADVLDVNIHLPSYDIMVCIPGIVGSVHIPKYTKYTVKTGVRDTACSGGAVGVTKSADGMYDDRCVT